ncbi:MAG: lipoyl synthase [Candidatus Humimicrobiaceae bacterium]
MNDTKPDWLKVKFQRNENTSEVEKILRKLSLFTVCEEANCPNIGECFNKKTATFMIMGRYCTRNCTFCNVKKIIPRPLDTKEPVNIAEAVNKWQLKYIVITSVTRDDLPDGGAGHFANVIKAIRDANSDTLIEVLIPDFGGAIKSLQKVVDARPDVINHNIETVPRLYPEVRPMAVYGRSLELLANVKMLNNKIITKSGIMLGLGENHDEFIEVFKDLRSKDCDFLTIGQYLAPSKQHHPVIKYYHPDIFNNYRQLALKAGFKSVASAPLVRSSYNAVEMIKSYKSNMP